MTKQQFNSQQKKGLKEYQKKFSKDDSWWNTPRFCLQLWEASGKNKLRVYVTSMDVEQKYPNKLNYKGKKYVLDLDLPESNYNFPKYFIPYRTL